MRKEKKLLKSFKNAFRGIIATVKTERNMKIHIAVSVFVIALGIHVGLSAVHWAFVVIAIGLVMVAETVNTAIEKICDLISIKHNQKIKEVKDIAAGAVLIAAIVAVLIACCVFLPYFFSLAFC